MKKSTYLMTILILLLAGLPAMVEAQEIGAFRYRIQGGVGHQLDTSIDGGGKFNLTTASAGINTTSFLSPSLKLDSNLSYELSAYDFSGSRGFGALDPWSDIHSVQAGLLLGLQLDREWALFGGPMFNLSAESGADLGDAITGGGILGVNYRPDETFSIGIGVGAFSRLEKSARVIPLVLLNWKLEEDLTLRSGRMDPGAGGGFGLELAWDFAPEWELAFGGQYQNRRFRLDDSGDFPDGIGEHTSFPIYTRLSHELNERVEISVYSGITVGGKLRLEDDRGHRITEKDHDPGFILGGSIRF